MEDLSNKTIIIKEAVTRVNGLSTKSNLAKPGTQISFGEYAFDRDDAFIYDNIKIKDNSYIAYLYKKDLSLYLSPKKPREKSIIVTQYQIQNKIF